MTSAAIQATIGADVGPLNAAGPAVAAATDKLAGAMEHRLLGARHVASVVAVALGLNIEEIAKKVARLWTGVSEEEEAALKKLEDVSTRAADSHIAAMRAQLSAEKRYQLALQEREQLTYRIAANGAITTQDQIRQKEDQIVLDQKETEIAAYRLKQEKELHELAEAEAKKRRTVAEAIRIAAMEELTGAQKVKRLKDEIWLIEEGIKNGIIDKNDVDKTGIQLEARRLELIAAEKEAKGDIKKHDAELLTLAKRRAEEEERIARAAVEQARQAKLKAINDAENAGFKHAGEMLILESHGVAVGRARTPGDFNGTSSAALLEVVRRDREKIAQIEAAKFGTGIAGAASGYLPEGLAQAQISLDAAAAQKVIDLRKSLRGADYNSALRNFGGDPTAFDALYRSSQENVSKLEKIGLGIDELNEKFKNGTARIGTIPLTIRGD